MQPKLTELTDRQREVLRLVSQGFESKEIARALGISHFAVNQRIERAVRALGARNRKQAARLFAEWDDETCERITREPIQLEAEPKSDWMALPDETRRGFPWPFATPGRYDGLGKNQRLFWALIGIPILIMLAWGVFLSGVSALDVLKL